jgi:hypothetical protein
MCISAFIRHPSCTFYTKQSSTPSWRQSLTVESIIANTGIQAAAGPLEHPGPASLDGQVAGSKHDLNSDLSFFYHPFYTIFFVP